MASKYDVIDFDFIISHPEGDKLSLKTQHYITNKIWESLNESDKDKIKILSETGPTKASRFTLTKNGKDSETFVMVRYCKNIPTDMPPCNKTIFIDYEIKDK